MSDLNIDVVVAVTQAKLTKLGYDGTYTDAQVTKVAKKCIAGGQNVSAVVSETLTELVSGESAYVSMTNILGEAFTNTWR